MRIAYVCADGGIAVFGDKGASVHIRAMAQAFRRTGNELRLLCARRGAGNADYAVEQIAADLIPPDDRADKERGHIATATAIEARLVALYRDWPFDLIYERYSLWSAAGVRAGHRLGVPVVVEVNAPLITEQVEFRTLALTDDARAVEAEVFRQADALAVVSDELVDYVTARGAAPGRVHVIRNAVDTTRFTPRVQPARPPGIPDGAFVVGFSGSLKAWHGLDTLLPAFRALRDRLPDAHLLVVGDGPRKAWVEGYAEGAGLAHAVTLTGWVAHDALPGLIARMDVATAPYPAVAGHYFSPLKLYEYLAVGRPVVASRIGQTAQVLDGTGAAVLVRPGDVTDLTDALLRVALEPGLARRLADNAAKEGRRYDWADNARAVLALVKERLSSRVPT
ncbi:MAG: glycosyltransferase family 4 protein [Paracoccaceae bacterium]